MKEFSQIIQVIQSARNRALSVVNSEVVNLYWQVGPYVSKRLEKVIWGDDTVAELAHYIQKNHPGIKGFDKKNLYRMCGFYTTYRDLPIVAPVARKIQSSDNKTTTIVIPVVRQLQ